jgi:cell division protein FtsB
VAVAVPKARPGGRIAAPAPALPLPGPRARPRRAARPRLRRGVAWIAVVAALLAGIVALNVAALEARMERGKLQAEIVRIQADSAAIEAELSRAASAGRIEPAARGRLGLAEPTRTEYVKLKPPRGGR